MATDAYIYICIYLNPSSSSARRRGAWKWFWHQQPGPMPGAQLLRLGQAGYAVTVLFPRGGRAAGCATNGKGVVFLIAA